MITVTEINHRQRGAALVVSLLLLLVMTTIGMTIGQSSTFVERATGNSRDRQLAFEAAESGLDAAEDYIENSIVSLAGFDTNGTDGLYDASTSRLWEQVDWDGTDSGNNKEVVVLSSANFNLDDNYGSDGASKGSVKSPPRYIIEHLYDYEESSTPAVGQGYNSGSSGGGTISVFRVTVRGTGGSDNSKVILQSMYGRRL